MTRKIFTDEQLESERIFRLHTQPLTRLTTEELLEAIELPHTFQRWTPTERAIYLQQECLIDAVSRIELSQ